MLHNNAIYRYSKGAGWCKHGIVYTCEINGHFYAIDTYWDSEFNANPNGEKTVYSVNELNESDLEFVMYLDDVKETDGNTFEQFSDKDKIYIPIGGWVERFLINKNAKPNTKRQQNQLCLEIDELERLIEHNKRLIDEKKQELNKINHLI